MFVLNNYLAIWASWKEKLIKWRKKSVIIARVMQEIDFSEFGKIKIITKDIDNTPKYGKKGQKNFVFGE